MPRESLPRRMRQDAARLPLPILLGGLLLLGACGAFPGTGGTPATTATPTPSAASNDAAASFVLNGGMGNSSMRMGRSYHAASGRECREVLVGTGAGARSQLVCQDESGVWSSSRSLLRGGGTR